MKSWIGHRSKYGVLAAMAMMFSGCTYMAATPSVQGKAYVVRNAMYASDFWNCDATAGDPVCYQTKKKYLPAGSK